MQVPGKIGISTSRRELQFATCSAVRHSKCVGASMGMAEYPRYRRPAKMCGGWRISLVRINTGPTPEKEGNGRARRCAHLGSRCARHEHQRRSLTAGDSPRRRDATAPGAATLRPRAAWGSVLRAACLFAVSRCCAPRVALRGDVALIGLDFIERPVPKTTDE